MDTKLTETELLVQIACRNEQAFKTLFEHYRDRLFHYVSGIIKSREVAEELVMDVFLKVWLGKGLVTQIENMDAFLFRVAYNKSIDFLRHASRSPSFRHLLWNELQPGAEAEAESRMMNREFEKCLRDAILQLPRQRQQVYRLSREKGLSHAEIAGQLHLSKHTISNHIVESQRFIRSYLARHVDLALLIVLLSRI